MAATVIRDKRNWLIHMLYVRQEFEECLRIIEETLRSCNGLAEYPLFVKGLIRRQQGLITESLTLFQAATCLNPRSATNLKQVARSLFLLGRHKAAIDVYNQAEKYAPSEWEIQHNKGLCFMYLKQYRESEECFMEANSICKHDATYLQLGKVYTLQDNYKAAVDIYLEALDYSPDNAELLTTVGLLYLRLGENFKAFEFLGNSLTHDPRNPRTILAAGSIIQDHNDMDVALMKYRVAAVQTPNSAQLWNNIGMCFFGKLKYVAAIACLKRAMYLDPFEWIIAYNLGLVHLNTGQYASAFHYLSSSINLKPDFASAYMHLGTTLARLDDVHNACTAYDKAISMESDPVFHLNYAISLFNAGQEASARTQFATFEMLFQKLDVDSKDKDQEVIEARDSIMTALGLKSAAGASATATHTDKSNG